MKKLAVLLGSQSRGIKDTHQSINFFLSLFDVPYDVFICSDQADLSNFNLIKNIHSTISLEEIESKNPKFLKLREKMHKHYWQSAKIFGTATLLEPLINEYATGLKMRTDFIFDYKSFFLDHGFDLNIKASHLSFIKNYLRMSLHHCDNSESLTWKKLYTVVRPHQLTPFLYKSDRYIFSSSKCLQRFCKQLIHTANNIEEIYTSYIPISDQHDYRRMKGHLETIAIPKSIFPEGPPKSGDDIAMQFNSKKHELPKNKTTECHHPIYSGGKSWAGKDVFCKGKFSPDILSFINQLYTPGIIPVKAGFVHYMQFTRYENNIKATDGKEKIMIAFDRDATLYNENIQIQDQLKNISL